MQVVLAGEWAKRGKDASSAHPGWVDTPGIADSLPLFKTLDAADPAHPPAGRGHVRLARRRGRARRPLLARPRARARALHAAHARVARRTAARSGTRSKRYPARLLECRARCPSTSSKKPKKQSRRCARRRPARRARRSGRTCAAPRWPTPPARRTVRSPRRLDQVRVMANMRTGALEDLHELAVSIRETGLLHPPLVRATGEEEQPYELLAGQRRYAAMRLLDEADGEDSQEWRFTVVDGISRREALSMQFAENFHQTKPEPVQFARAARLIMAEDPSLTAAEVSRIVGAPPAWTRKALRLLELPEAIVERVERGDLSFTAADFVRRGIARGNVSGREGRRARRTARQRRAERRRAQVRRRLRPAAARRTTPRSPTASTPPRREAARAARATSATTTTAAARVTALGAALPRRPDQRRRRRRLRPRRVPASTPPPSAPASCCASPARPTRTSTPARCTRTSACSPCARSRAR